jgi:hypothetical protein
MGVSHTEEVYLNLRRPPLPPGGDIEPVDVLLPDGRVLETNHQATVDWATELLCRNAQGVLFEMPVPGTNEREM